MNVRIEPFTIDHYVTLCCGNVESEHVNAAIINQISGPAFTLMTDERRPSILAVGGVRVQGIGQAWAHFNTEVLMAEPALILKTARTVLQESIAHEKLYRVYAEATVDKPAWFKHLGFRKAENVYVRS